MAYASKRCCGRNQYTVTEEKELSDLTCSVSVDIIQIEEDGHNSLKINH